MWELKASYDYCIHLSRRHAGNFYPAFRLLPLDQRRAICALYSFFRIADDLADDVGSVADKRIALRRWREQLLEALRGHYSHAIHPALHSTVRRYRIPVEYLTAAIDGVEMDLQNLRYETFDDLRIYCYRVASVVGLSCLHVWGFRSQQAKPLAEDAGIAFQLTNILRDLGEDSRRGRVYLPAQDLRQFGYDAERLRSATMDDSYRRLMEFEVARARGFYDRCRDLPRLLNRPGRAVFVMMARTYEALLEQIERRNYDVFSSRVSVSPLRKLWFAARSLPACWSWGRW